MGSFGASERPTSTAGRPLRRGWPTRVELSRQDIHAGDTHGLTNVVDVSDQLRLSDLLVVVIEPFVPQVQGLTWTCRAKVRDEWVDVAATGSVDGPRRPAQSLEPTPPTDDSRRYDATP